MSVPVAIVHVLALKLRLAERIRDERVRVRRSIRDVERNLHDKNHGQRIDQAAVVPLDGTRRGPLVGDYHERREVRH